MSSADLEDFAGNAQHEFSMDDDNDTDDLEVELVDDQPDGDQAYSRNSDSELSLEDQEEINQYSGRAAKRIGKLKYEYHEERRAKERALEMREEAVRYAQQVASQNQELRQVVTEGESVLLGEMKARGTSDLEKARNDYRVAYDSGDTDGILQAQEDLNRAQRFSELADQQQEVVPDYIRQPTPQLPAHQQDPKLNTWMSRNPWFNQDQEMTSFAYGVHTNLVKAGVSPHSDEYYAKIDERIQSVFPDRENNVGGDRSNEVTVANPRRNSVVASAKRSANAPRKVQLSSTQVELAKRLGITKEQYAKQVLKEMRNG